MLRYFGKLYCPHCETDLVHDYDQSGDPVLDIPQGEEVRRYLAGHAEGLSLLVPIVARGRQEFPVPAQLSLELYHDPETGEQDLKLYVRQASYEPGFWRRLLKICEPFEESFAGMSAGWLHVTTDYRSPTV